MRYFSYTPNFNILGCMAFSLVVTQNISPAQALEIPQIEAITKEITVKVQPAGDMGSGVIISREEINTENARFRYFVLTAKHVIEDSYTEEVNIYTLDDKRHPIENSNIQVLSNNIDLALLSFTSNTLYQVSQISDYQFQLSIDIDIEDPNRQRNEQNIITNKPAVFVAGYPHSDESFVFNPGYLFDNSASAISNPIANFEDGKSKFLHGYELNYTNLTSPGMSGGPILDSDGRLIGIHGRADGLIIGENFQILREPLNEAEKARIKTGLSLGIPIQTFLADSQVSGNLNLNLSSNPPVLMSSPSISNYLGNWRPKKDNTSISSPEYWFEEGNQLWRIGNTNAAIEAFDRVLQLDPHPNLAYISWFSKGYALGFAGRFQESLEACTKAIEINRTYYDALRCRAGALLELGRYEAALNTLNDALKTDGNNPADYLTKGEILLSLGQYRGAMEAIEQGMKLRRERDLNISAVTYNNLGIANLYLDRYEEGLYNAENAIQENPNFAPAWATKGLALQGQGEYDSALEAFDQAVNLDSQNPYLWNNRGVCLYHMGQEELALASFNRALQIDPNYTPAVDNAKALSDI